MLRPTRLIVIFLRIDITPKHSQIIKYPILQYIGYLKVITPSTTYYGYRFPPDVISHAVWMYHRFTLSFRDVEDPLAERGIMVSYETIRNWCAKFGPQFAHAVKKRRGRLGDTWLLDEVYCTTVRGERIYLWCAIDQDGDLLDVLFQKRKDKQVARRFFKNIMKGQGRSCRVLIVDKLPSYSAAMKAVMPSSIHCNDQYANNRCEASHEHTREQERQMRRFIFIMDGH